MEAKNSDAVMQICSLTILFSFGIKNDFFCALCVCVCVKKAKTNRTTDTRWFNVGVTRVENPAARRETLPSDYEGEKGSPVLP